MDDVELPPQAYIITWFCLNRYVGSR